MKIAMSGATGFIGENLTGTFADKGWEVMPLLHGDFGLDDEAFSEKIKGADIVINLAGAAISARWTEEYKKIIYTSRINTTKKIVAAIGRITTKPRLFISTSAVGIYDTKGVYTEEDKNYADDFLGKLAFDWEQAALGAKEREIRTIIFRFGVVLGRDGGALNKMLPPFKLGLGGTIGDGRQPFPWVHIEDLISAYNTVIENESYEGIYNLTAP